MASRTAKKERPQFNPTMLRWAREWRGRTLEEAANKVSKTADEIAAWEAQDRPSEIKGPTVKQARDLADLYDRSFLEFFRDEPPVLSESELVPDYRMQRGVETDATDIRELKAIQTWAEEMRTNALDLYDELREPVPEVPVELFASLPFSNEVAAENARKVLNFSIEEQLAIKTKDQDQLPNLLRTKFERIGILTLRNSDLHKYGARGICIAASPLPIVVIGNEFASAQAFTLAHELGHVVLRQSAISGPRRRDNPFNVEQWCDSFSASFLMPRGAVQGMLGAPPSDPAPNFDDVALSEIAARFRVSQHAMLIRLVHLRYVSADYYWGTKKPQFDQADANIKKFARPRYYGRRYETNVGNLYTGLVLEAWSSGRITNHNAAEYMGIKNFEHLNDIRANFGTG